MAFKNLEEQYNAKVNTLYAGAKTKFAGGRPSLGKSDDPILVRSPGEHQTGITTEGRGLPFVSAPRDLKRLTLFSISGRGIAFLTKQQLLQTGNTFEQTRLLNPLFAVGNAIPFLHLKRNLRPLSDVLGKSDVSSVRKWGQLQQSTYDAALSKSKPPSFFKALGNQLLSPIKNTISAVSAKRNVGEAYGYTEEGWKKSRPELGQAEGSYLLWSKLKDTTSFSTERFDILEQRYNGFATEVTNQKTYIAAKIEENPAGTMNAILDPIIPASGSAVDDARLEFQTNTMEFYANLTAKANNVVVFQPFLKYFDADNESIQSTEQSSTDGTLNARDRAIGPDGKRKKISYLRDPANTIIPRKDKATLQPAYEDLPSYLSPTAESKVANIGNPSFDDPIVVSFAMGKDDPIQFRAFIRDLQQSANPEYKPYQYIGRIEKFVSYVSVQRELSFKLGVIAFSETELEAVWRRINYLTGMVFPYGFNKGLLQPNIIRLTIGGVYVNQPGYITALNTSFFNDISESWDLDAQVPISAVLEIKFNIIEKHTAIASTPFYGITENMSGFTTTLTVPSIEAPITDPPSFPPPPDIPPLVIDLDNRGTRLLTPSSAQRAGTAASQALLASRTLLF